MELGLLQLGVAKLYLGKKHRDTSLDSGDGGVGLYGGTTLLVYSYERTLFLVVGNRGVLRQSGLFVDGRDGGGYDGIDLFLVVRNAATNLLGAVSEEPE
jgi:hypothetical protein